VVERWLSVSLLPFPLVGRIFSAAEFMSRIVGIDLGTTNSAVATRAAFQLANYLRRLRVVP